MAGFACYRFFFLLSIVLFQSLDGAAHQGEDHSHSTEKYFVPVFTVADLENGNRLDELADILKSTGLLSVSGTPSDIQAFSETQGQALQGLCECATTKNDLFRTVQGSDLGLLSDGSSRTTVATATIGSTPLPLQGEELIAAGCTTQTVHSMETLRDQIAWVSHTFVSAVDRILVDTEFSPKVPLIKTSKGLSYSTLASIVESSQNLEHFHVYDKDIQSKREAVLDVHTDAGLFLTFSPGMTCGEERSSSNLHVKQQGVLKEAVFSPGTVGVMLGAGAEHWLRTNLEVAATKHAVTLKAGSSRAWYGMMHTVPQDAYVQDFPKRTFSDMRKASSQNRKKPRTYGDAGSDDMQVDDMSIGCGTSTLPSLSVGSNATRIYRRRLQHVASNACDNVTSFFCWNTCREIPQAENAVGYITEGYSLYCLDPSTLASTGNRVSAAVEPCNEGDLVGGTHYQACVGSWQPTAPGVVAQEVVVDESLLQANAEQFCFGGTSMYMDGFHWTDTTCVIYLFQGWTLTSAGALVGACLGTIIAAMGLEGIIYKRRSVVKSFPSGNKRLMVSSVFYGVQLGVGYLLMLVVMTYSAPLFLCVILGLMCGHFTFSKIAAQANAKAPEAENQPCCEVDQGRDYGKISRADTESDGTCVPEGATPCCQNTL